MNELLVVIPIVGLVLVGLYGLRELRWLNGFDKENAQTMERIRETQEWLQRMELPVQSEQPVYPPLDEEGDEMPVRVFPYPRGLVRMPNPRDVTPGEIWK